MLRISIDGDDPTWPGCAGTINLQIILIRPRDSYLNRATKKILAKVFYPKRSRNRKVAESRVWLLAGYNKLESVPWDWSSSSVSLKNVSLTRETCLLYSPGFRWSEKISFACRFHDSGNFCLWNPDSRTLESVIQLQESGTLLTIRIGNPSSTDKESGMQYLESRF